MIMKFDNTGKEYHECEEDDLLVRNDELNVYDQEYSGYTSYKINYCPICGLKVIKEI